MAGTDATLLSLSGAGYADSRSFGFASCPRVVGAAEGMNVLLERKVRRPDGRVEHAYNVTNVEYTEFEKQGICDVPAAPGSQYSCFPANTNVLYVGLKVRPSHGPPFSLAVESSRFVQQFMRICLLCLRVNVSLVPDLEAAGVGVVLNIKIAVYPLANCLKGGLGLQQLMLLFPAWWANCIFE